MAEFGTFTQMTGDAPGENTGDIDFEMMAGTWYLDAEADAPSILVFDENGGWELLERPGGDGDPTTVDSGTIELAPEGSEEMYLAVSSQLDDVGYEFTLLDQTRCAGAVSSSFIKKWHSGCGKERDEKATCPILGAGIVPGLDRLRRHRI